RRELDDTLARERLQVLLGGVGRAEPELRGDLGPGGREAGVGDVLLDQREDLLLARGEVPHRRLRVGVSGICIFIQYRGSFQAISRSGPGASPVPMRIDPCRSQRPAGCPAGATVHLGTFVAKSKNGSALPIRGIAFPGLLASGVPRNAMSPTVRGTSFDGNQDLRGQPAVARDRRAAVAAFRQSR